MWGFLLMVLFLCRNDRVIAAPSLCLMLGLFTIWTETALVERRLGWLSRWTGRKTRLDDPLPFAGAILGVILVNLASVPAGMARGALVPLVMAWGAFGFAFVRDLDWRRSLLSSLMVVYNGTGGAILRAAMTFAVWVNILRGK